MNLRVQEMFSVRRDVGKPMRNVVDVEQKRERKKLPRVEP